MRSAAPRARSVGDAAARAVVEPAAVRAKRRAALLWAAAVLSAWPLVASGAGPLGRSPRAEPDEPASAAGESPSGADSTAAALGAPRAEPRGPDVRDVRSGGPAEYLDARPLSRFVGSGRLGGRASLARGALPAAMTAVLVDGRRIHDRIEGGLALCSAWLHSDGTPVVPSGPDLSLLPLRTASALRGPTDPALRRAGGYLSAVGVSPGRSPGPVPWSRISMGRGDLEWGSTGVEFGRTYREGRFGVAGFLELQEGGAPSPGGSCESEELGGRTVFALAGGWRAEAAAMKSTLKRLTPVAATSIESERVRSDVRLALSNARSALEIFHTGSWVRSEAAGGARSAESAADGVAARVTIGRTPLDSVHLEVASVAGEGSLLAEPDRAFSVSGLVSGRLPLTLGVVTFSAGGERLGEDAFPRAAAGLSGGDADRPWSVSAAVGGRVPTAVERLAAPLEVPGSGEEPLLLEGNEALEPERAFVVRAEYAWLDVLSGVGLAAELADVSGAITVEDEGGRARRPVNGDDDLAAAASVWAAVGDSLSAGARSTLDVFWMDEEGPLVSLEPVPRLSAAAAAWVTSRFFEDGYLEVRWELALRHESGLGRGPWRGLVDDALTHLDACAAARAGPVRIFLEVRDLLDAGGTRVPDRPLEGRRIAAGFSTSLWN